ncbi:MAG: hypothetical protein KDA81_17160 [Planctomycetaceae bacterium]|nr:hypothetical protein [Planctomycetaceae bacterium]
MKLSERSLLFVCITSLAFIGCGGKADPNVDVKPDQVAPENVEDTAGYAEAMGGGKK